MTATTIYRTGSPLPITWPDYVPPALRSLVADDERIMGERRRLLSELAAAQADEHGAAQRDLQAKAKAVRDRSDLPKQSHVEQNRAMQARLRSDLDGVTEALWQVRQEATEVLQQVRPEWLASLQRDADNLRRDLAAAAEAYVQLRTRLAEVSGTADFVQRFPHKPQRVVRTHPVLVREVPGGSVSFAALSQALLADAEYAYTDTTPTPQQGAQEQVAVPEQTPQGVAVTEHGVLVMPDADA